MLKIYTCANRVVIPGLPRRKKTASRTHPVLLLKNVSSQPMKTFRRSQCFQSCTDISVH